MRLLSCRKAQLQKDVASQCFFTELYEELPVGSAVGLRPDQVVAFRSCWLFDVHVFSNYRTRIEAFEVIRQLLIDYHSSKRESHTASAFPWQSDNKGNTGPKGPGCLKGDSTSLRDGGC